MVSGIRIYFGLLSSSLHCKGPCAVYYMTCATESFKIKMKRKVDFKEPVLINTVALFLFTLGFSSFQNTANLFTNTLLYARHKTVARPQFARIFFCVQLPALREGEGEVAVAVLRGEQLVVVVGQGQRVEVLDEVVRPVDVVGVQHRSVQVEENLV